MSDPFDLRRVGRAALDWWWVVLAITVLGGVLGLAFGATQADRWEARVTLRVGPQYGDFDVVRSAQGVVETYVGRLDLPEARRDASARAGLPPGELIGGGDFDVNANPDTRYIGITGYGDSPEVAVATADALGSVLIDQTVLSDPAGQVQLVEPVSAAERSATWSSATLAALGALAGACFGLAAALVLARLVPSARTGDWGSTREVRLPPPTPRGLLEAGDPRDAALDAGYGRLLLDLESAGPPEGVRSIAVIGAGSSAPLGVAKGLALAGMATRDDVVVVDPGPGQDPDRWSDALTPAEVSSGAGPDDRRRTAQLPMLAGAVHSYELGTGQMTEIDPAAGNDLVERLTKLAADGHLVVVAVDLLDVRASMGELVRRADVVLYTATGPRRHLKELFPAAEASAAQGKAVLVGLAPRWQRARWR